MNLGDQDPVTITAEQLAQAIAKATAPCELVGGAWLNDLGADEWLEWAHEVLAEVV